MDKFHTYINTFKQKITPIFIINLIGILFLYLIIINTQKYTSLIGHDFIYPWRNLNLRLPAQVFETVFNNFLPSIFNIHPADMRTGFGLCNLILSFLALFICLLLTKAFFLYEGKKMVFKKEFLIILPLAFLSVFNPISFEYKYILFFRMEDLAVAGEYFFVLIPFFLSLIILYRIIFRNYQPSKFGNILYLVIFFVLGCYNELTNLTFFFIIIIFLSSLFVFDKEKLKNKNLYKMLIAFFAGIIYFYLVSNQLSADLEMYNFDFKTLLTMLNINKFLHEFFIYMFAKKYLFFIVYTLLIIITILLQKDKETKLTVCYSAAIILGYLLTNLTTIFVMGMNNEEYIFEREFFNQLYLNILTFAFLVCLGTLYKNIPSKKYIICFILIIIFSVIPCYTDKKKVVQRQQINQKILLYNIDKINLVYSTLGEISILPESYQNKHRSLDKTLVTDTFMKHQPQIITNQYYLHGFYGLYFETVYKKILKGVRFEPDETAYQELNKRLKILNDESLENKATLIKNNISFQKLYKKYKGKTITLDYIQNTEKNGENKYLLLKTEAYLNFRDGYFDKAEKLYEKYLKSYPYDADALLNLAAIYKQKGLINQAENCYQILKNYDKNNIYFKILDIDILYNKKDFENVLKECNEIMLIEPDFEFFDYKDFDNIAIKILQNKCKIQDKPE